MNESLQKGTTMSAAMLAIATGVTLLSASNPYGIILILVGFGFVAFREWMKMNARLVKTKTCTRRA